MPGAVIPPGHFKTSAGMTNSGSDQLMRGVVSMVFVTLLLIAGVLVVFAQPKGFTPREENPEEFAAGPGRDETFYTCTACHNFKLVAQQGMSRRQWDETITVMNEKHNMPKLDAKEREVVLNYLETAYPPRVQERGWQNPFLNR